MEERTLGQLLRELDCLAIPHFKVPLGVFVPGVHSSFRYVRCCCNDDAPLIRIRCDCGGEWIACESCFDRGNRPIDVKCLDEPGNHRKSCEPITHLRWRELDAELVALSDRLNAPIDFDDVIAKGLLERVSDTQYRLPSGVGLVGIRRLPQHVQDQIIRFEQQYFPDGTDETCVWFSGVRTTYPGKLARSTWRA